MSATSASLAPESAVPALVWLAQVFWGPDPQQGRALIASVPALESLAEILGPDAAGPARELAAWLAAHPDPAALCRELEPAHVALFIARPGGVAAPPYQSCYQDQGLLMGPPAREMALRLEDAGLALARAGEPPDHLAAELEYLAHLLTDPAAAEPARDFASRQMLPWVARLARRLAAEPGCPFYALAAALAVALLGALTAGPGPPPST